MIQIHQFLSKKFFTKELKATRDGYGDGVVIAGEKNKDVVVLCCDVTESTKNDLFQKRFPDRFIEVGIAEQNMASLAAGLALEGKIPFAVSYAVFNPGRNWDQIRVSVCYNNANVKIVGSHSGFSAGQDGATHHALEDIALARVLPRMTVVVPCDYHQAKKATIACASHHGPVYLRLTRNASPSLTQENSSFQIGRADVLKMGKNPQVAIIGCGPILYEGLLAADILKKENIGVIVINNHTIKPLDEKALLSITKNIKGIVTIEEHQVTGGLFGAISELFSRKAHMKILPVAVNNSFGESGTSHELLDRYGLRAKNICENVRKILK